MEEMNFFQAQENRASPIQFGFDLIWLRHLCVCADRARLIGFYSYLSAFCHMFGLFFLFFRRHIQYRIVNVNKQLFGSCWKPPFCAKRKEFRTKHTIYVFRNSSCCDWLMNYHPRFIDEKQLFLSIGAYNPIRIEQRRIHKRLFSIMCAAFGATFSSPCTHQMIASNAETIQAQPIDWLKKIRKFTIRREKRESGEKSAQIDSCFASSVWWPRNIYGEHEQKNRIQ